MRTAVITGISGQDGYYLANLLLSKDYKVVGVYRRTSRNEHVVRLNEQFRHYKNIVFVEGDVSDISSMRSIVHKYQPDEFYNLAAQSHVGTSFEQPLYTWEVTAGGCVNVLEAVRYEKPDCRVYQASSSEMFGKSFTQDITPDGKSIKYQNEKTPMVPQSPYAVAKLAAHHTIRLYRDSYNLFACSGVLFNHETLSYGTPVIIKYEDKIDILPIGDVARYRTGVLFDMDKKEYQEGKPTSELKIWDQNGWVDISWVSGYPHEKDKQPRIINARNFVYTATGSHPCIMEDGSEKNTSDLQVGDKVKNIDYPTMDRQEEISLEEAEWLGMMVGDGNLHRNTPRFTNKDPDIYTGDISPFGHKNKKVPQRILNSSIDAMEAFLVGYNACDGLKKNGCKYRFKNFKTNSPTLAAGLLFLVSKVTGQLYNITVEESWAHGKQQFYYSINLLTDRESSVEKYQKVKKLIESGTPIRKIHRDTGISRSFIKKVKNGYVPSLTHALQKCSNEIKKIIDIPDYNGWFFDLETSSGTFHAGVGQGVVHNSPHRGENFVTRKITKWIGRYLHWRGSDVCFISDGDTITKSNGQEFPKLRLGNLNVYRDWGHAKDYCRAMYLMMQEPYPDDYVVSSMETHSVKDFLKSSFHIANLDSWERYVVIDKNLFRPCEVEYLMGDSTKARNELDWTPEYTFESLVKEMVIHDIEEAKTERR